MLLRTSEVPLQSSTHGQERRTQRNISKRDLQAAVKYGTKERGFPHPRTGELRWKYTFADVVYITDESSTIEVTSWVLELPIEPMNISQRAVEQHQEARRRNTETPGIITAHYVCVVDMSASMRDSDMNGHRSRFRAVYYSLAEELILPQITGSTGFTGTEVVTLIEMRNEATVVFEAEPLSLVLYNRIVELALRPKDLAARQHGNYLPSLREAFRLLAKYDHVKCAPTLFFLSDGKPSDHVTSYKHCSHSSLKFLEALIECVKTNCKLFTERFTFVACGYGNAQFDVLESMIVAAAASGVKKSEFLETGKDSLALSNAMSSIISSTTETSTMLSRLSLSNDDHKRVHSKAVKENYVGESPVISSSVWRTYKNPPGEGVLNIGSELEKDHGVQNCERFTITYNKSHHAIYVKTGFLDEKAAGIMVKNCYFGEGAERIVYEMTEVDENGVPVGIPLVAKESIYEINNTRGREDFHLNFLKTQKAAGNLAKKFNAKLDELKVDRSIPRLTFLECFVYSGNHLSIEFLAEKRLTPELYRKWNNNAGGVEGVVRENKDFVPIPPTGAAGGGRDLGALQEGDEDEDDEEDEDESDEEEEKDGGTTGIVISSRVEELQKRVLDTDVPQAFSHWTNTITKRKKLVCDLQGELVATASGLVFECTDPCIHKKEEHRRGKRDRTDKGAEGINQFFSTHHCNALCEILLLKKS